MRATRRIYIYGMSFFAFLVTAIGAVLLLDGILEVLTGNSLWGGVADNVGVGAAMVIAGGPVWAFHHNLGQKSRTRDSGEAEAVLRKVYVYGALAVSTLWTLFAAQSLLSTVLTDVRFPASDLADVLVPGGFWTFYWMQEQREGQATEAGKTVRRWYVYGASLVFLTAAIVGLAAILDSLATRLYEIVLPPPDIMYSTGDAGQIVGERAAWLIVGSAAWVAQWSRVAIGDAESSLRRVYLYLFAVIGGALLTLWAFANMLNLVWGWILGVGNRGTASEHFDGMTYAVAQLAVGIGVLAYHWFVLRQDALRRGGDDGATVRSTFLYIMSAIGLGSLVPGVILLIGGLFLALERAGVAILVGGEIPDILAPALTMVMIGALLWLLFWARIQTTARITAGEAGSLVRRIYVYGVLLVLGLAALSALIAVIAVTLTELLQGESLGQMLSGNRWFMATLIPTAAIFGYHAMILRNDMRLVAANQPPAPPEPVAPEGEARPKSIALVAPSTIASVIAERLREATGGPVTILRVIATDESLFTFSDVALKDAIARLAELVAEDVLIVLDENGFRLLPLMESPHISG